MSLRLALVAAAPLVLMGPFAGHADAQTVSFTTTSYEENPAAQPTIAPRGTFAIGQNMEGHYRVSVVYGSLGSGAFKPYEPVPKGVPKSSVSEAQKADAKGGVFDWVIDSAKAPGVTTETQIQATLQKSTDGGKSWEDIGSTSLMAAIPAPPP